MADLKACPFCGGENVTTTVRNPATTFCEDCGAAGPPKVRPSVAISAWNRRLDPVKPTDGGGELAALEAVMATVDPAKWPGLTLEQRTNLGRFAKPALTAGDGGGEAVAWPTREDVLTTLGQHFTSDFYLGNVADAILALFPPRADEGLRSDMGKALDHFDKTSAMCPFNRNPTPPKDKPCSTCGAERTEGCRREITGAFGFVYAARAALSSTTTEELGSARAQIPG